MNLDSKFKEKLKKALIDKKLNPNSITYYIRNMELLNGNRPLRSLTFLNNVSEIMEKLKDYAPNTKRNYIISICSCLSALKKDKTKVYKTYFEDLKNMNFKLKKEESQNTKSATQQKNWQEWNDIENKYNELKNKVDEFKDEENITKSQYNTLLKFIVLSLYTLQPPRRNEYLNMKIVKKYDKDLPSNTNYLSYDDSEFVFNKYKTAKTEGQVKIPISKELMDNIKIFIKLRKLKSDSEEPLIANYDGEAFTAKNTITMILNSIFKPKKISSSLIRHIYLSHKYGHKTEEQKRDAKEMGHSVSMARDYIKTN